MPTYKEFPASYRIEGVAKTGDFLGLDYMEGGVYVFSAYDPAKHGQVWGVVARLTEGVVAMQGRIEWDELSEHTR